MLDNFFFFDLIEPLQKLCASSVSGNPTVQSSPKKPLMEVMVQGPQTKLVKKYLKSILKLQMLKKK
jgi:translation initiation factor 1 (eIF-1/SUI1)